MLTNLRDIPLLFKNKKIARKVQDIIFSAELKSARSGASVSEILKAYYKQLKGEDPEIASELRKIINRIRTGLEKSTIYKNYIDDDVYHLFVIAEKKKLPPVVLIEEYLPVKKVIEDLRRNLKAQLKIPLIMYSILSIVFYFILQQFKVAMGMIELSKISLFIIDSYGIVTGFLFIVFFLGFFVFPHKMIIVRNIFKLLEGIIGIAIAYTSFRLGLNSVDIVPMLRKFYRFRGKISNDMEGLVYILSKYLTHIEVANIMIAKDYGDIEEELRDLKNEKMKSVKLLEENIASAVKNLSVLLTAVPVALVAFVFIDLLSKVMNML